MGKEEEERGRSRKKNYPFPVLSVPVRRCCFGEKDRIRERRLELLREFRSIYMRSPHIYTHRRLLCCGGGGGLRKTVTQRETTGQNDKTPEAETQQTPPMQFHPPKHGVLYI